MSESNPLEIVNLGDILQDDLIKFGTMDFQVIRSRENDFGERILHLKTITVSTRGRVSLQIIGDPLMAIERYPR